MLVCEFTNVRGLWRFLFYQIQEPCNYISSKHGIERLEPGRKWKWKPEKYWYILVTCRPYTLHLAHAVSTQEQAKHTVEPWDWFLLDYPLISLSDYTFSPLCIISLSLSSYTAFITTPLSGCCCHHDPPFCLFLTSRPPFLAVVTRHVRVTLAGRLSFLSLFRVAVATVTVCVHVQAPLVGLNLGQQGLGVL